MHAARRPRVFPILLRSRRDRERARKKKKGSSSLGRSIGHRSGAMFFEGGVTASRRVAVWRRESHARNDFNPRGSDVAGERHLFVIREARYASPTRPRSPSFSKR